MKKSSSRAVPFIETRHHHLRELAEDYVEIIADLFSLKGEARVCDIAEHLGVTHVTVIRSLSRLKKGGYLLSDPSQPITLSPDGWKLATFCKERHLFLLDYLVALGVPEETARVDVEGMEHHISKSTIEAFERHLTLLQKRGAD